MVALSREDPLYISPEGRHRLETLTSGQMNKDDYANAARLFVAEDDPDALAQILPVLPKEVALELRIVSLRNRHARAQGDGAPKEILQKYEKVIYDLEGGLLQFKERQANSGPLRHIRRGLSTFHLPGRKRTPKNQ